MKKTNICCCCMLIICRNRMAKAKRKAWFGFMFIDAQYPPEMKSDKLCLFWPIYVFQQCNPKIVSHFSALLLLVSTFWKFFGRVIFGLGCSATWTLAKTFNLCTPGVICLYMSSLELLKIWNKQTRIIFFLKQHNCPALWANATCTIFKKQEHQWGARFPL